MDDIELIKSRINIIDFIGEYLPLKKAGVNYKANCPFHQEGTPSFMVSPERGIFHCFGCGVGGDIFKFLMLKEGLEFPDAIEILAQKAGVTLKKKAQRKDKTDRLYELNQKAQQFFQYILLKHALGKKALTYVQKRGLTSETIETFGVGYAPNSWDSLTNFLKKRGFTVEEIIQSGMGVASTRGCYDRFRGRIMFPLIDIRDRIIGFSGRILDKGEPKYINSPQTPIFDKSHFLFGLHLAKGAIREKNQAILVEGEMDMILSFQSGIKNIVATKGTALTPYQIEGLKKYTDTLGLCFDGDIAGDSASRRGIEIADSGGMNMKVIEIKGAKDPAELCLDDPKKWEQAVADAVPIYDYYLNSASHRYNPKTAQGKRELFQELSPIWRKITDPMVKEHYLQKLAALLQVKDEVVRKEMDRFAMAPVNKPLTLAASTRKDDTVTIKDRRQKLEEYLVALLLHIPDTLTYVPDFPETLFTQEHLKQIYVLLVVYLDSIAFKGKAFKISDLAKNLPPELTDEVDRLYLIEIDDKLASSANWQKEVDTVKLELKKMLIKSSLEKLSLQIKNAQEFDKIEALQTLSKRFRDLSVKLKNL